MQDSAHPAYRTNAVAPMALLSLAVVIGEMEAMNVRRCWPILAGTLMLILTLVGCGSSDDDNRADDLTTIVISDGPTATSAQTTAGAGTPGATTPVVTSVPSTPPSQSSATAATAMVPTSTATGSPAATEAPTTAPADATAPPDPELLAALPQLDDLPAGWTVMLDDQEADDDGSDDTNFCGRAGTAPAELFADGEVRSASVSYAGADFGPFLIMMLVAADDEERMRQATATVADLLSCSGWTDADGTEWTGGTMSFPALGEETTALAYSGVSLLPLDVHVILVRDGNAVLLTVGMAVGGSPDAELEAQLIRDTLARLGT